MAIRRSFQRIAGAFLAVGLLLGGCALPPPPAAPEVQAAAPTLLGPGDRLHVIVFGQTQLSGDFAVADDGDISLPLIGRLHVAGMTLAQAERALKQRLAKGIITEPEVSIDVLRYRPVYVLGEVARPGGYEPTGRMRVISAVALAGGFTYRAKTDQIILLREGDPDRRPVSAIETTPVGPGDVIIVPERWF